MQYVSDDMDDLFRRAGKEYPLRTDGANWEKIEQGLTQKNVIAGGHNNRSRKLLCLVLLLPLLLHHRYTTSKNGQLVITSEVGVAIVQNDQQKDDNDMALGDKNSAGARPLFATGNTTHSSRAQKVVASRRVDGVKYFESTSFAEKENNAVTEIFSTSLNPDKPFRDKLTSVQTEFPQILSFNLKENADRQSLVLAPSPFEQRTAAGKQKRIYAGIIGGAGVTTIKFQKTRNYGFELGLIAGYNFNKHWSIEAAVLSTQKAYYTDGKEFNTSGMYIPPNTKITTVDGSCRMMELPVVLRFDFSSSRKNSWFVSTGISNFLMKEENYDYTYFYANSGRSVKYSRTYKNTSENWISTAQISGGYTYHVKDKFAVRAEPYAQIPLKGTGFGNLPLTGAGLRIGLTKKLF